MRKTAFLALLLAACLLLSGCALIVKDMAVDAATEVVKVNGVAITKGEINAQVTDYLAYLQRYYQYYGQAMDITDKTLVASAREEVVNGMIQQEVVRQKQAELLGDVSAIQLTEEEKAEAAADWQENYDLIQRGMFADTAT